MNEFEARDPVGYEHTKLCKQLREWAREYYLFAEPSVPDAEYDRVFRRVQEIEAARPDLLTPSSPTQTVGSK